jgi:inner membrane transporter RhtA
MADAPAPRASITGVPARLPPSLLFVVGAISMYVGAAVAVETFDEVAPQSVAWLRVLGAAGVLAAIARPWRAAWTRADIGAAAAFGTVTAVMNTFFYLATDRVHLGSTVAIEFLGPVAVAAAAARTRRALAALVLAGSGVAMLGVGLRTDALGVAYALGAAACWAGYIVTAERVSTRRSGVEGLAVALAIGAVAIAPIGAPGSGAAWSSAGLLFACLGVGILSTVIPYGIDQHVLRRVERGTFALLLALLPATATVVGLVALRQTPAWFEAAGIALVVAGLAVQGPTAQATVDRSA